MVALTTPYAIHEWRSFLADRNAAATVMAVKKPQFMRLVRCLQASSELGTQNGRIFLNLSYIMLHMFS